jgi:hypothetical protein
MVNRAEVIKSPRHVLDDTLFTLGNDNDAAITLVSAANSADAEVTNLIEGTSDHQGTAANSLVLSNVTNDGDIQMLVSDNGDSKEFLLANGDTADLQLGHGMATATVKTASGVLTLDSGAAINIEPASGSAILLDGTISIDAGVVTGATSVTSTAFLGTIDGVVGGNTPAAITGTDIRSHAARPSLQLSETGASADQNWEIMNNSGVLTVSAQSDDFTGASARMTITNAGIIQFPLGELDMNTVASGGIRNVGAPGNDWTANSLAHVGSVAGTHAIYLHNLDGTNATSTRAHVEIKVSASAGNASGDPSTKFTVVGGSTWAIGVDNSESDRFAIANDGDLGSDTHDALRISTGEVMTVKETIVVGYDYWCDGCGRVGLTMFDCCGKVEWHDDTAALSLMSLSEEGLQHMAKIGVMEVDDSQKHRWVGINIQAATHFTWGAVRQNRQRMDSQYEELNKRLEAIGA